MRWSRFQNGCEKITKYFLHLTKDNKKFELKECNWEMKVELCQNPETRKIHKDVPGQNSLISENQPFWIWSTIWYQSTKVDTKQSQKDDKKNLLLLERTQNWLKHFSTWWIQFNLTLMLCRSFRIGGRRYFSQTNDKTEFVVSLTNNETILSCCFNFLLILYVLFK
jgi:hypothetical protein